MGYICSTPDGIPYAVLVAGYDEVFVRDANHITAVLKVAGENAADFRTEMLGTTAYSPGSSFLNRSIPVLCPLTNRLRCQSLQLVGKGWRPNQDRESLADEDLGNWLNFFDEDEDGENTSWVKYRATFARPRYNAVLKDEDTLVSELYRYCTISLRTEAREQKIAGNVMSARPSSGSATGEISLPEVQFVPDYNTHIEVTWWEVPADAVPITSWNNAIGTVNDANFTFPLTETARVTFAPEKVKFYGPLDKLLPYEGADGNLYYSPTLVFTARGGPAGSTWNTYRLAAGSYNGLYVGKYPSTNKPHTTTDFTALFTPIVNS